jgi:pimeloyl-ACP methyl ester carboxylesterase
MRRVFVATIVLIAAVACGGRQPVFRSDQADGDGTTATFELPDPIPASPAWVASLSKPASNDRLSKASKTPGVAVLAPVSVKKVMVKGPTGKLRLRVASVDPLPFRSVAPASTRDAEFVWTALMSDRAVITFDAAQKLGVKGSEELAIGSSTIEVGAFADNGIPNIADVLVSPQVARQVKLGGPTLIVFGAKSGTTIEALGRDLRKRLPGAQLRRIRPETQTSQPTSVPESTGSVSGATIGTMQFRILQNGFIDPDPAWVASNITTGSVPILGSVRCHRIMIPQLASALQEISDSGLASEIRPGDYAGCYVPRFIDRDPRRGLSMHAFGLAVDLNVSTNGLGTRGDMDPTVVQIFQKWGFTWGGVWGRPDPMHFELARIVR